MKHTAHIIPGEYGDKGQYKYNVQIRINKTYFGTGKFCEDMAEAIEFCKQFYNISNENIYFENSAKR